MLENCQICMKNISKAGKWFLKLIFLFISFIFVVIVIFLFRPDYFIDDIEIFIKDQVLSSTNGEIIIGNIDGNFVEGFRLNEVVFQEEGLIIFSAGNIYIDPDLSRIITGKIVLSQLVLNNSYYNYDNQKSESQLSPEKSLLIKWRFDITSLLIEKSLFVYKESIYEMNGDLKFEYNNGTQIDISVLNVQSPKFSSPLVLSDGIIRWYNDEWIISNLTAESDWLSGKIDGTLNLNEFNKTSGSMIIDNFTFNTKKNIPVSIHDLNLVLVKNNDITQGRLKGDLKYNNILAKDISVYGILQDTLIQMDSISMIIDGKQLLAAGKINPMTYNWNGSLFFENFPLLNKMTLNGQINLKSLHLFDIISGEFDLYDTYYDSLKISSIAGDFQYKNGMLTSEKLYFASSGYDGELNIQTLINDNSYDISGSVNLKEFESDQVHSFDYITTSSGKIDFKLLNSKNIMDISAYIRLEGGQLFKKPYNEFYGDIDIQMQNGIYSGKSSGNLNGWEYEPYEWDSLNFNLDITDNMISTFKIQASNNVGDTLQLQVEQESNDSFYIPVCEGFLKQTKLTVQPFFIKKRGDYFHLPQLMVKLVDHRDEIDTLNGEVNLTGNYKDITHYELTGKLESINLNNIYSIIGQSFRINGLLKTGNINIEMDGSHLNPSPVFFSAIELENGSIDDIQFNNLILSASYRNHRVLINNFLLETQLGSIRGDGWFNYGFLSRDPKFSEQDKLDLSFYFENIDLVKFNRYLPWGLESRGLISGSIDIEGKAKYPEISSTINVQSPGFDKINARKLSGKIYYKNKRLDLRNLSLITETGHYSGSGFLPIDLNLLISNRADISKEPIDFIFTGSTNSIEFLPQYFNIIDSLTQSPSKTDTLNSYFIELLLTGTLANPIRNGKVIIHNGTLFIDPINEPITNLNGILSISQNKLIIDNLTGNLRSGKTIGLMNMPILINIKQLFTSIESENQPNIRLSGSIDLEEFFNPNFAVHVTGEEISLTSSYGLFTGIGSADISITGQDTIFIVGEFIPAPYEFTITSLGSETSYDIDNIYTNRVFSYNLHIPIKDGIKVETDNINLLFEGDINIAKIGDEDYNISGKANIIDGNFYDNQGNVFQNMNGTIILSPANNIPYIDIHAQTIIDTIVDVSFIGYTDNPTLFFDTPNYTQTEILQILTFSNTGDLDDPNQAGNLLSNYLENEVEKNITRYSALDEFQLTSKGSLLESFEGNDVKLKLMIGKQISNRIYLNTQFNLNEIDKSQYEATYRLNNNASLVGGMDEENLWHLRYRIKYYYK